ncbi:BatD family protein [Enterobacteriaceae bacterium BIT-l23]|uniref:BatD family protein n=1 Tax=Jejubacter sp. L23 TaxID=3092086 RepID=UPI00158508A2|nr:BatD family protein [Enterobacteriaceae bacterium BIT-l23]
MRMLIALLLLLTLPARADMQLTRELVAPDTLVPGQPVRVAYTFWTDSWFNPAPTWPELPVSGGEVLSLPIATQLVSRREGGKSWSGIRMERLIATWDSGQLHLPAAEVTLTSAGQAPHTVALAPLNRPVHWPKGTRQPDRFLPAADLKLTQQIIPHATRPGDNTLRVGDAIDRRVTLEGAGVLPAAIPQLLYAIPGNETQLLPRNNQRLQTPRGDFTGARRVETLRYLPSRPGSVVIPPLTLRWWDSAHQRWRVDTLPGKTLTIAPAPATGKERVLQAGNHTFWPALSGWLVGALALLLGLYLLRHPLSTRLTGIRRRWQGFWQILPLPGLAPTGTASEHAARPPKRLFSPPPARQRAG